MIREGSKVEWTWGNGKAKGEVIETFHEDVTKTIEGNKVTREASKSNPAYLIKQSDGSKILKSKSEVSNVIN